MMATTAEADVPPSASMVPGIDRIHRPRKRVLTEARRKQNLVNQRTYRRKQRAKRLQGLQRQCQSSSTKILELWPWPTNHAQDDERATTESACTLENVLSTVTMEAEPTQEQSATNFPLEDVAIPQVELPLPLDSSYTWRDSLQTMTELGKSTDLLSVPPSTSGPPLSSVDFSLTSNPSELEVSYPGPDEDLVPSVLSSSNETAIFQHENEMFPSALEFLETIESSVAAQGWSPTQDKSLLSLAPLSDMATELRSDDLHCHQNLLDKTITNEGFDLERVIAAGLEVLLCGHQPGATSQTISSPCCLPNPRTNSIQFSQTKIFLACIQNAQSMGFLVQDAIMPRCLATSPFHRPVTPADDPKKLLAILTTPSTPVHLKPTLPQVLYPHPAFMDLIPIPVFRARAITLAATQPQLFDIWELKKDIFVEDGLVHWSSISSGASSGGGQGQPWDMRSWEAAPWFLRKWRMLIDGEEGELWKQSLWWQRARK